MIGIDSTGGGVLTFEYYQKFGECMIRLHRDESAALKIMENVNVFQEFTASGTEDFNYIMVSWDDFISSVTKSFVDREATIAIGDSMLYCCEIQ